MDRLKQERLLHGMTQEEVASAIGITKQSLSNYEQGRRMPRDWIKKRLSKMYNTTVEELFFGDEPEGYEMEHEPEAWREAHTKAPQPERPAQDSIAAHADFMLGILEAAHEMCMSQRCAQFGCTRCPLRDKCDVLSYSRKTRTREELIDVLQICIAWKKGEIGKTWLQWYKEKYPNGDEDSFCPRLVDKSYGCSDNCDECRARRMPEEFDK